MHNTMLVYFEIFWCEEWSTRQCKHGPRLKQVRLLYIEVSAWLIDLPHLYSKYREWVDLLMCPCAVNIWMPV